MRSARSCSPGRRRSPPASSLPLMVGLALLHQALGLGPADPGGGAEPPGCVARRDRRHAHHRLIFVISGRARGAVGRAAGAAGQSLARHRRLSGDQVLRDRGARRHGFDLGRDARRPDPRRERELLLGLHLLRLPRRVRPDHPGAGAAVPAAGPVRRERPARYEQRRRNQSWQQPTALRHAGRAGRRLPLVAGLVPLFVDRSPYVAGHHPGQRVLRDAGAGLEPAGRLHRPVLAGAGGVRHARRLHHGAARLLLAGAARAGHPGGDRRSPRCSGWSLGKLVSAPERALPVAHDARRSRRSPGRDRQLARVHPRRPGHARGDADGEPRRLLLSLPVHPAGDPGRRCIC